ncbi:MAG: glycosyltransferase family 4 protein [Butyrivibrio sp.]|nr:glycosyltransferase family 4 protein [Butyrivibrio sp.]
MRVLWVCNIMLPVVADHLHLEASNKEGWLTGLSNMILKHQKENEIELGVCFPVLEDPAEFERMLEAPETGAKIYAFGFYEDVRRAEVFEKRTEKRLKEIMQKFEPDIVHCFGTEYPHTLAAVKAFDRKERTLIGIQGLCSIYAKYFRADLPDHVWKRVTFRDRVKQDDLRRQHEKYVQRGVYEIEAVQRAGHITGRTGWDKKYTREWNPEAKYHFMNETLRPDFYEGEWQEENCKKYSIFLSQGDYPIKGLHYMLQAMPDILERYPEAEIYAAGNSIIKSAAEKGLAGLKGKLKLESYGKYILQLMKETGTLHKVHFLGRLDAEQMKEQYLKSHVFVCPSSIENSPNSVGEAMLLGVPAVCADVGGVADIFTDRTDGLLYPAGNVKKLAEAVKIMFAGGERVRAYREAERLHARKTHDAQRNYERLMEIYKEMIR